MIKEIEAARHAGEMFTLQRAAYLTEAQLYDSLLIPPLVETLDEIRADIAAHDVITLGAWEDTRLVGSVRGRVAGDRMEVARFAVAPDMRGRGIGQALLAELESRVPAGVRTLWLVTGARSVGNLRLYGKVGYVRRGTTIDAVGIELAMMEKPT